MSHFVTLVLIPGETPSEDIDHLVSDMLDPYSEHLEVEEYETECSCIGIRARIEVEEQVNATHDIEDLRKQFKNLPTRTRNDKKWEKMIAPRQALRQKLLDAHPLKDKPVHDCNSCKGTGRRMATHNPDSKWDFWVIGGRWDGWIYGPEREKACSDGEGGFNFGNEHQKLENNCRRVSEIPVDDPFYVPFAIVTPKEWIEQGSMGWWSIVSNEMSDEHWHQSVKTVLAKYPEHLAVAVDCHV